MGLSNKVRLHQNEHLFFSLVENGVPERDPIFVLLLS